MAHSNGRIFIDTSTTPHKGVEIADLQQVLGRGTGDLGLLCSDQEWYLLPYQRIEYLESTGTQYIDTVININDINFEVEAKLAGTEIQTSFQTILGTLDGSATYGVALAFGSGGKIYIQLGDGSSYVVSSSATPLDVHIYNASLKNGVLSISADGGSASTRTKTGTVATSSSMYMFARHRYDSTIGQYAKAKIYYLKIWNDGVLVRDFYPVRVGNVGYMYDLISGQLFGNLGSGAFVLGEDVDSHALRPLNPPRINRWAWHKPIRQHSFGYDTRNLPAGDDGFNGDQPVGEFCIGSLEMPYSQTIGSITPSSHTESGVTVTKWMANSGFFFDMMRGNLAWNYRKPRGVNGTYTEPFRIFDFVGYNHRCVSPMPIAPKGSWYVSEAGQVTLLVDVPDDLAVGNMSLSTMKLPAGLISTAPALSSFYVGILLYRPNYEDCVWKTATARIGTSSTQNTNKKVSFSSFKSIGVEGTTWNKMGTWYARTFLSTHQLSEGQNPADLQNFVVIMASEEVQTIRLNSGTITNDITIEVKRAKWIEVAEGVPSQIRVYASVRNGYVHDAAMSNISMSVASGDERSGDYFYDSHIFDDPELATLPMLDEQSYSWVFNNVPYEAGRFTVADFHCTAVVVVDGTPITKNLSFFVDLTPGGSNPEPELT